MISVFFATEQYVAVHMYHIFIVYSGIEGRHGYFHFPDTVNRAGMNMAEGDSVGCQAL